MKNRRIVIMAFLLCACLVMGIGYAAYSDIMDINGVANMDVESTKDGNLYFSAAEALVREGEDTTRNTASINGNNKDAASFTVNDVVTEGDAAKFKFTITNTNSNAFNISVRGTTLNTDAQTYYSLTTSLDGVSDATIAANGGTMEVLVTVTMTDTPASGVLTSASFLIELQVDEIVNA